MANPIPLNQSSRDMVLQLFNEDNNAHETFETISFGIPTVAPDNIPRNTQLRVTAVPGKHRSGFVDMYYNRLNIGSIFASDPLIIPEGEYPTTLAVATYLNDTFDLHLDPEDYVLEPLIGDTFTLTMATDSYAWLGTLNIETGNTDIDIGSILNVQYLGDIGASPIIYDIPTLFSNQNIDGLWTTDGSVITEVVSPQSASRNMLNELFQLHTGVEIPQSGYTLSSLNTYSGSLNSRVNVKGVFEEGYNGQMTVYYNRYNVSDYFYNAPEVDLLGGQPDTKVLRDLENHYGIILNDGEFTITGSGTQTRTLTARPNNFAWIGSKVLSLKQPFVPKNHLQFASRIPGVTNRFVSGRISDYVAGGETVMDDYDYNSPYRYMFYINENNVICYKRDDLSTVVPLLAIRSQDIGKVDKIKAFIHPSERILAYRTSDGSIFGGNFNTSSMVNALSLTNDYMNIIRAGKDFKAIVRVIGGKLGITAVTVGGQLNSTSTLDASYVLDISTARVGTPLECYVITYYDNMTDTIRNAIMNKTSVNRSITDMGLTQYLVDYLLTEDGGGSIKLENISNVSIGLTFNGMGAGYPDYDASIEEISEGAVFDINAPVVGLTMVDNALLEENDAETILAPISSTFVGSSILTDTLDDTEAFSGIETLPQLTTTVSVTNVSISDS